MFFVSSTELSTGLTYIFLIAVKAFKTVYTVLVEVGVMGFLCFV